MRHRCTGTQAQAERVGRTRRGIHDEWRGLWLREPDPLGVADRVGRALGETITLDTLY